GHEPGDEHRDGPGRPEARDLDERPDGPRREDRRRRRDPRAGEGGAREAGRREAAGARGRPEVAADAFLRAAAAERQTRPPVMSRTPLPSDSASDADLVVVRPGRVGYAAALASQRAAADALRAGTGPETL